MKIKGKGKATLNVKNNVKTTIKVDLKNVMFIPGLHEHILSINKLTEEGFRVTMEKRRAIIRYKNGMIMAKGKKEGGLYSMYSI
jgi:hypothetical protein